MRNQFKRFHFKELGWIICFPVDGNEGKYVDYTVVFNRGLAQPEISVKLGEILDAPEFDRRYPHTVGYYRESSGQDSDFKPDYLELRRVCTVEEFWLFLNSLNI